MKAYKCDICKKYCDLSYSDRRKVLSLEAYRYNGETDFTLTSHMDVCDDCAYEIHNTIEKLKLKEASVNA